MAPSGTTPNKTPLTSLMRKFCKWHLEPYNVDENNVFKSSKLRFYAYLLLTGIMNFGAIGHNLIEILDQNKLKENPFYVIGCLQLLLSLIYAFTATTLFLIRQNNNVLDIFNQLAALEKITPLSDKESVEVQRALRWHLVFFSIATVFNTYSLSQKLLSPFKWAYVFLGPLALLHSNAPESKNLHFIATIALLRSRMDTIQQELATIPKNTQNKSEVIHPFYIAWESSIRTKNVQGYHNNVEKVRHIREKYAEIHRLKKKINDIYGMNLLVFICIAFYAGVFYIFWNITIFQYSGTQTTPINMWTHIRVSGFTAVQVIKITMMIATCQRWKDSAMEMGGVLHDVINRVQHRETVKELLIFSSEIRHRDPRISAAGFCDIDFGLLREIAGSVTMYIIILIQFKFTVDLTKMDPVIDLIAFL